MEPVTGEITKSLIMSDRVPGRVEDDLPPIFCLTTNIAHQVFLFIEGNRDKLRLDEGEETIRKNFLSAQKITDNSPLNQLIMRVSAIVEKQIAVMLSPSVIEHIARLGCLYVPLKELKNIHFFANSDNFRGEKSVDVGSEEEQVISVFVKNFNRNFSRREFYREKALKIIEDIEKRSWIFDQRGRKVTPNPGEVFVARKTLFALYSCDDPLIMEKALWHLIEIVECDPLTMDSALGIVKLQEKLTEKIRAREIQNLNVELQRLLVKAYSITLACILIHASKNHLNALTEEIKDKILICSREIADSNIVKDPEINFWAKYAVQGAFCIKTGESNVARWLVRIADVSKDIIMLALCVYQGDGIIESMDMLFDDMRETFRHIGSKKEWFASLLVLKKFCHYWMNDAEKFSKIVDLIKQQTCSATKEEFLYGLVSTLEYVSLKSTVRDVKEDSLKLLLQYYLITSSPVNERVKIALGNLSQHGDRKLKNTARILLALLDVVENRGRRDNGAHLFPEKLERGVPPLSKEMADKEAGLSLTRRRERVSFLFRSGGNFRGYNVVRKEDLFANVIEFLIRRMAGIKERKNYVYGADSLVTLLSHSTKDEVIPPILQCLAKFSTDFWAPGAKGETPYHIAARAGNRRMVSHIKKALGSDINVRENEHLNTALHIAVEEGSKDVVRLLLDFNADSNIRNRYGQTPLHLAVIGRRKKIGEILLEKGVDGDIIDENGKTALDIAIERDIPSLTGALLRHSSRSAVDSPIIAAARNRSVRTIIYLLRRRESKLTPLESFEILRMISKDGRTIRCGDKFCRFHLRLMKKSADYAQSFGCFADRPVLMRNAEGKFELVRQTTRKETLPYRDSRDLSGDFADALGNTLMIRYAKNDRWLSDLSDLIACRSDLISKANILGVTPLHAAVISANIEAVRMLVEKGAEVNAQDCLGCSPLHFAAFLGYCGIMKYLIEREADYDQANDLGKTPFLLFCGSDAKKPPGTLVTISDKIKFDDRKRADNLEVLRMMATDEAAVLRRDNNHNNALHLAAAYGLKSVIRYLCGCCPELFWQKNDLGFLPINIAIRHKRTRYLRYFFPAEIIGDPKALNERFMKETGGVNTVGDLLVRAFHTDMLEKLFELFADAPYKQNNTPHAFTPLHTAAFVGNTEAIDVYVRKKKKLDLTDAFGNTPAHIAVIYGNREFLEKIISAGVDIRIKNNYGSTLLHLAAALENGCREEIFTFIFARCPKLAFSKDSSGDTPLHIACNSGHLPAVKMICEKYPPLTRAICDDVNLPLHLAAANGFEAAVAYLSRFDPDLDAKNAFRLTPLMLAAQQGHLNVVRTLLTLNAEIRSRDYEDETALHKASFNRHVDIIEMLLSRDRMRVCLDRTPLADLRDANGNTALLKFVQGHREEEELDEETDIAILRSFMGAEADFNVQNNLGDSFLHEVCLRGLNHILDFFIGDNTRVKTGGIDFMAVNGKKESLLHKAVAGKKLATVMLLINPVDIDCEDDERVTPLLLAAKSGFAEIARFLWRNKADIAHCDRNGQNILHHILQNGSISEEMEQFLYEVVESAPELILKKDKKKRTPFHILAENGHAHFLELLLTYLPGNSEKYFTARDGAMQTAYEIALEKNGDLARKIAGFPKERVGYAYRTTCANRGKKSSRVSGKKSWKI